MSTRFDDPIVINGKTTYGQNATIVGFPEGSIGNTQISGTDPIDQSKLKHQYLAGLRQAHGSAAADERRVIHVARAAGTVEEFQAGCVVASIGDSTVTFDLRKNGTTVLTGVVSVDSGDAAYAKVTGDVDTAAYVAGDVFEVVIDATVGTGTLGQGAFCTAVFREGAG